ncbi:CHAT domain-containing protein [Emticicia sp. BO119]|uniref:CHAT domain-containing protein n=1 Tax=Emticicia sp. BO119 TaxID=2757768 RepID=UPI0015F02C79|nr:CHAT domain-containing tetratricopeptide repeat protein [Emticicia sp. BO119]MBA4852179.1 CHAT domain-containing protein [Emticicia sp. BO119]
MRKSLLISVFAVCVLNVWAQSKGTASQVQRVIDEVYMKLNNQTITPEQALLRYKSLQKQLLIQKDYENYFKLFLISAVDVYVPNEDYDHAAKVLEEGLAALKYVDGELKDLYFFKLNAEVSEYYRRMPSKLNLAEKHFKKGYDFLLQHKSLQKKLPAFIITFLSNYGRLIDDLGDTEQSFYYFQQARQIAKQEKVTLNQYAVLSNMAKYYREKKQYENALGLLKEALPLAESDDRTAIIYLSIGRCYNQMKQPADAIKALAEAEKYYRKPKEQQPRLWINIQTNRAESYMQLNNLAKAESTYKSALKDFVSAFHHFQGIQVAKIENGLSEIYEKKGNFKEALIHSQKAMIAADTSYTQLNVHSNPTFEAVNAPQELFIALNQKADLLSGSDPGLSADTYITAIKFATHLRKTFDMPESKLFYSEKVYPVYEKALSKIFEQWKATQSQTWAEKFFYTLEASKSATLWDAVKEQKIRPKVLDENLLDQEATLRQRIVKLQIRLLEAGNEKTLSDLSDAKIQLSHLTKKIEQESKNYYKLKYDNYLISLKETQQKIDKKSAFISYFLGENVLYYLIVDKESYNIVKKERASDIHNLVLELYAKVNTPPSIDAYKGHDLAKRTYNVLLAPIEGMLKKSEKLIIARHDILGFLPYEILEKKGESDYLLFDYTISYANSASLHFDYNISKPQSDIIAYAPFSNGKQSGIFRDKGFKTLPASINEMGEINGQIFQDSKATKLNFQETYRNKGIIHFATHAQVNDAEPLKSFIALYPEGKDFKLYTPELYNLSLENTQLVVLSACETGKGQIRKGEGIISLARAFQFAGCPSVITTLWNAHDESIAKLSEKFYYYLKKGYPTDEAIRLSKIDLIQTESDHPFYWSNFVLIGKSSVIPISSFNIIYLWLGLFSVLMVCMYLFRAKIATFFSNLSR